MSDVPPQAPVWYMPAPHVAHAVQVVSLRRRAGGRLELAGRTRRTRDADAAAQVVAGARRWCRRRCRCTPRSRRRTRAAGRRRWCATAGGGLELPRRAGRAGAARGVGRSAARGGAELPGGAGGARGAGDVLRRRARRRLVLPRAAARARDARVSRQVESRARTLVQVVASVQVAQPAGQAAQVASAVAVQAAVWYWPAAQVVQALQTTPVAGEAGLARAGEAARRVGAVGVHPAVAVVVGALVDVRASRAAAAGEARRTSAARERSGRVRGTWPPGRSRRCWSRTRRRRCTRQAVARVARLARAHARRPAVLEHGRVGARSRRCWSRTRRRRAPVAPCRCSRGLHAQVRPPVRVACTCVGSRNRRCSVAHSSMSAQVEPLPA